MTQARHRLRNLREELDHAFRAGRELHLRDRLRDQKTPCLEPDKLSTVCGVKSQKALTLLSEQQSRPEHLIALMLVPVLLVVWADRKIADWERGEILDAAEAAGIPFDTPAFKLIGQWLEHRPKKDLKDAWKRYVRELCLEFNSADRARLAECILRPARHVAEASGAESLQLGHPPWTDSTEDWSSKPR